ncbi:bifunctional folylpolyglutamate synthase/dihydrofolate synthase [Segatella hominis]|uniref:bifunctional folylpolyglutamate synthase/dihydrofolate synthase n=1 Tax=Segatella hominis TaxID=2518605 RepID=UPI0021C853FA|nr:folylpolyglutamate synthase/dihydrofolate synthase family protein [Segatella hominis]
MNYQETIEYLFNSTPVFEKVGAKAYKPGLQTTETLDKHFGHPHRQFKSIHVAGTNGKGSCSHTLAAILQSEGYKVGLFTSPHLVDFRERIRVNRECISEQYIIDFVEKERRFFEPLHPSFFELTTALAFKYFAEQKVDIAIIEVGLGGRLDCTNIITPILSIITNISKDHTQFLGNTLADIAGEKAGIIKPGVPVIIGEDLPETRPVFQQKAQKENSPIIFAQDENQQEVQKAEHINGKMEYTTRTWGKLTGELCGDYQAKNMNTILNAVKYLTLVKNKGTSIKYGISHVTELTGLMGRWQKIQDKPLVICDTGHNVGGWQYLAPQIKAQACRQLRIVFGMVDDKDVTTVMKMLPKDAIYYWTQATTKRAIKVEKIAELGTSLGLNGNVYSSVNKAFKAALADATEDDFIFVGGSSYIVADFLS